MAEAEQILNKVLLQIAKEQNFTNYNLRIEPITSGGGNYTSNLYNVILTEDDKVVNMFAKVASVGDKVRTQTPKIYEIENFAYTKLSKIYEQLEEENHVPQEHRLIFSKFYGCNTKKYEETIVLENLVMKGFQTYDRFKSYDWEYAKTAITELSKMHALSFAYSECQPKDFNNNINNFTPIWKLHNDEMKAYYNIMADKAVKTAREEFRSKLQTFFDSIDEDKFNTLYNKWSYRPVLGHGDYRPNNLLHRIRADGSLDIKIVDLQTLQGSSPLVDLLYFIFTGSEEKFRAQYYEKLIDHYYAELHAAMKRLHLDPEKVYSRKEFELELKEKLPVGLLMSIFMLPVITVNVNNVPQMDDEFDFTAFTMKNSSDLYTQRLNGVVSDYIRWGVLD